MIIVPFVRSSTRSNLSPPSAHSRLLLVWHRLDRLCKTRLHDVHLKADSSRAVAGDRWWRASERRKRRTFKLLLTIGGFERFDQNANRLMMMYNGGPSNSSLPSGQKKRFRKTKQLMMFVKMEIGQNIKESKWRTDDTPFRGFWPLLPFQAITGLKIKLFFSDPFLLFVVYNTQRHSDGCEIQYIGSSVFILLLLGVSLNVIRSISFQIPFLQVLFQLAATSMLGCPALMVSHSK